MGLRFAVPEGRTVAWAPNSRPQSRFLEFGGYEALYGGAAGGGKSDALLGGALRYVHEPRYTAIIFRRTFPELERGVIERSRTVIPAAFPRATYNEQKKVWRFPSGARLIFAHLEYEHSVFDHQGAEYQYIGFDELTHFTRKQYLYLLSRGRSASGIPIRIRAGTNPGGEGHAWVMERWAPWLDPASTEKAEAGQSLWYVADEDGERYVERSTEGARARLFVPALARDNPAINADYAATLNALDAVTRAQLRDGNWLIKPAAGLLFKRAWFPVLDTAPRAKRKVRRWDFAATEAKPGRDPDWTVGALWSVDEAGQFTVEDVVRLRGTPLEVEKTVLATAQQDGRSIAIRIPQDPGAAGVTVADNFVRLLAGYDVRAERETGSKVERAKPASAQAERGNVRLVRGPWNAAWLAEHEAFPDGDHDDQVDTTSGAVAELTGHVPPTFAGLPRISLGRRNLL